MRRLLAGVTTILLMGGLLWFGLRRPASPKRPVADTPQSSTPEPARGASERINALLESAASGDVAGYLGCFDGPCRQRLEREVNERGRPAFAENLRRAARSRKSHAVFAPEAEGDEASITVESVYADRNERQTYRLALVGDGWRITDVETVRGQVPKAKYGTPANFQAPEGVPVPAEGIAVETGDSPPGIQPTSLPALGAEP